MRGIERALRREGYTELEVKRADALIVETESGTAVVLFDPMSGGLLAVARFAPDPALTPAESESIAALAAGYMKAEADR